MALPKIEWMGTAEAARRKMAREALEREIEYLEQTFTPMTAHKLKQELLRDDPAHDPDSH
jgi:hypothetical protein